VFNEITKLKANNLKGHIKFVCVRILVGKCGTNTRVGTYFKFVGCGEHSEPHQSRNANGAVRSSPHPTAPSLEPAYSGLLGYLTKIQINLHDV
jgi:hypothetical protein